MIFYIAAAVAIASTLMMLTRLDAVHALLYLIISLLAVAVVFYVIGAPFIAALEVIIYAGAIMVFFVFVVMMLNLGRQATELEKTWLKPGMWLGPAVLAGVLICEVAYLLSRDGATRKAIGVVSPQQVGIVLFGPYVIGVELASMLLLAGLVGAYHIGRRQTPSLKSEGHDDVVATESGVAAGGNLVCTGTGRSAGAA